MKYTILIVPLLLLFGCTQAQQIIQSIPTPTALPTVTPESLPVLGLTVYRIVDNDRMSVYVTTTNSEVSIINCGDQAY